MKAVELFILLAAHKNLIILRKALNCTKYHLKHLYSHPIVACLATVKYKYSAKNLASIHFKSFLSGCFLFSILNQNRHQNNFHAYSSDSKVLKVFVH